jgi:ligand-binding sensor domain-containing protein
MKSLCKLVTGIVMVLIASLASGQTFTNFTDATGLPSNNVTGVAIDTHNNKWFATQAGVAKFNDTAWTIYTKANGIIDSDISCIGIDSSGTIWAGTSFGVSKFDGAHWTSYTVDSGLVNNMLTCIAADPDGSVWFGTTNGISHLSGSAWTSYASLPGNNNNVSSIAFDSGGTKYIGTWIGGLVKFDGTTFTTITADSILSGSVTSILIDPNDNKWLGTYSGISVLDHTNLWVKNYRQTDGLYNNYIQDMCFDSKANIWIGMYADYIQEGGITKFDGTNWTSYSVADGMVNQLVHQLAVDKRDNIWIATGNGVSRFTDKVSGIAGLRASPVKIFPNPASDLLSLTRVPHPMTLTVLDFTGRKMMSQNLSANSNEVDISRLNKGMYILELSDGDSVFTSKILVE